ncbi:MAG TPA: FHA domain-containing protein [Ktedonobacteraceae bacterium]
MTGMIGHSARVLEYWQARDAGTLPKAAIRKLANSIKEDTHGWLHVSAKEYSQATPINFGAERIEQISKASGISTSARAASIDAARRNRHALIPLDPSNWRRLFIRNGKVLSSLPELGDNHPLQRAAHAGTLLSVMKSLPITPKPRSVTSRLSVEQELGEAEQNVLKEILDTDQELDEAGQSVIMSILHTDEELDKNEQAALKSILAPAQDLGEDERTLLITTLTPPPMQMPMAPVQAPMPMAMPAPTEQAMPMHRPEAAGEKSMVTRLSIGALAVESAKTYAFLEILQDGQKAQRFEIKGDYIIVGRADPNRGIVPEVDLTQFDSKGTVSRQHARIRVEKDHFSIEDLKSRNRTRIGETYLVPLKQEILHDGDEVSFGSVKATFRLLGTSRLPEPWSQS